MKPFVDHSLNVSENSVDDLGATPIPERGIGPIAEDPLIAAARYVGGSSRAGEPVQEWKCRLREERNSLEEWARKTGLVLAESYLAESYLESFRRLVKERSISSILMQIPGGQ